MFKFRETFQFLIYFNGNCFFVVVLVMSVKVKINYRHHYHHLILSYKIAILMHHAVL